MGCVYIFTWRHIWSFKRCLERMYELNVTIQHWGSLRILSSNTYSLDSGGLLEIRCEYDCQHHHKGVYWTCEIRCIRILESITAWRILLRTYTYKVETQQRRRWLATSARYITNNIELSFNVSVPYLVRFNINLCL